MSNILPFPLKQKPAIQALFSVGESFTTQDGVRVHIMQERETVEGRQFLYCAHGTKVWAADNRFVRAA